MTDRGRALVLALLLLVAVGGCAVGFVFLRQRRVPADSTRAEHYLLTLNEISVNLADQKQPHYLTASVVLGISGPRPERALPEHEPEIRDGVVIAMSKHTYQQLLTADGKAALKDDLAQAVGRVLAEENLEVTEVLFTSFLMN